MSVLTAGIVGLNVYAVLLVVGRGWCYGTRVYRPMLVNICLSVAPLVVLLAGLATVLAIMPIASPLILHTVVIVVGVVWLVVLPNSCYLITELNMSHRQGEEVPLWFDIMVVITLAMSGVFNAVLSVFVVQLLYALFVHPSASDSLAVLSRPDVQYLPVVVLVLSAFGMYLGRYVRFNSWDLLHPVAFARKFGEHFRRRGALREAVGFTVTHAVFLGLVFVVLTGTVLDLALAAQTSRA